MAGNDGKFERARRKYMDFMGMLVDQSGLSDLWVEFERKGGINDEAVVAVDGGAREIELSDGSSIVIARAIAVNNVGKEPIKELIVDRVPVHAPIARWVYLVKAECEVAIRAIENDMYEFLLLDGSLYAKVTGFIHELILTKGFLDLYYIPEVIDALNSLVELLEKAKSLDIKVIFVSKDSKLKVFKDYMLFNAMKSLLLEDTPESVDKDIIDILNKGIDWYSIVWIRQYRNRLLQLVRHYDGPYRDFIRLCVRVALSQSISDVTVLEELARIQGVTQGVTKRLLVGAMDAYLNHKSLINIGNLLRLIRDRIEDSAGLRSVDEYGSIDVDEELRKVEYALKALPRIVMMYVKFNGDDTPIMVEIPYYEAGMFDTGLPPKILDREDSIPIDDYLVLLSSLYVDPVYYNKLLWLAHQYARFSEAAYAEYVMTIASRLGLSLKRGLSMKLNIKLRGHRC